MKIIVEFRPSIGTAIPGIVNLLSHSEEKVREAGVCTLSRLSGQGETDKFPFLALLITTTAEFQHLISPAIPTIVNLLKDSDLSVRLAGSRALSTLSEQGKIANLSDLHHS